MLHLNLIQSVSDENGPCYELSYTNLVLVIVTKGVMHQVVESHPIGRIGILDPFFFLPSVGRGAG